MPQDTHSVTTFISDKASLGEMLGAVAKGTTQLPDFQRGWVWDDEQIKSLLASVTLSFPIGSIMLLETGSEQVRFKPRPIEGVALDGAVEPDRLVLDGQQRLTSLFQALYAGEPVKTTDSRGKAVKRWYYLDIARALNPHMDREEAIVSVPEDRIVRNFRGEVQADYSTREKECAADMLPFSAILDSGRLMEWQMTYMQQRDDGMDRWRRLLDGTLKRIDNYQVPLIILKKETPKEAVCQVFEKVNTGGVSLTVFELLTATFAADDFSLRDDWAERRTRLREHEQLDRTGSDEFLQVVTLLATYARRETRRGEGDETLPAVSCKRRDILRLDLEDYEQWADDAERGLVRAAKLLHGQMFFEARDIPYRTQIVPLAALLTLLGDRGDDAGVRQKLVRWFWCGVFGEMYGSAVESRFANDLVQVPAWIDGGPEPATVQDANFVPTRLLTLRTRNSAAYKGLYALLLRDGERDFRTGESITGAIYYDESIDIHHIFPRKWCKQRDIERERRDSIVNKTAISRRTNRMIGGKAPSRYLDQLQDKAGLSEAEMNAILRSHAIDPDPMRADDFEVFFQARAHALLARIEGAMGKPVARDAVEPEYADLFSSGASAPR